MPIKILMPALSPTMTEGNLAKWHKNEGDKVQPGDLIAEIETDKAIMEIEAVDEGVIGKILIQSGTENVPINSIIAVLLEEGEDRSLLDDFITHNTIAIDSETPSLRGAIATWQSHESGAMPLEIATFLSGARNDGLPPEITTLQSARHHDGNSPSFGGRIFASPLAKNLAKLGNINLANITGTGPHGRIIKVDLLNYSETQITGAVKRSPDEQRLVPNNNMRKLIAKRLVESKQTIPHFYLSIECNVDKLLDVRQDINKLHADDKLQRVSVNDLIILAVAKSLKEVPEANASWADSSICYYNNIDISVAVAIDGGLITPIIRNADQKNIIKLSTEMKELAKKAKENKLRPEEFQGGGFSISNLGMYGIKNFNAIINPPQSCILAVGSSFKKPVVIEDQIKIANIMEVTLSSDHRVVDGAVGAKFLASFKKYIETPILMLL